MAGLQSVMMPYLLLTLAAHPFFGSGAKRPSKSCSLESITAECGTEVDLLCIPKWLSGKHAELMSVEPLFAPNEGGCIIEGVGTNISQNGRSLCFISESKVGLHFHPSKITDTGHYEFYIQIQDFYDVYEVYLQINGTKKIPNISMTLDNTMIMCKVDGGCPVGHIQWSDNFGTNWTKSATIKEENGLIVSTLHLSPSSTMEEYNCMVTYQLMEKTETKTSCISTESLTGCKGPETSKSVDPTAGAVSAVYIIVPIALLVCGIIGFVIFCQRRHKLHGKRQASVLVDMNDTEMQVLREENGLQ